MGTTSRVRTRLWSTSPVGLAGRLHEQRDRRDLHPRFARSRGAGPSRRPRTRSRGPRSTTTSASSSRPVRRRRSSSSPTCRSTKPTWRRWRVSLWFGERLVVEADRPVDLRYRVVALRPALACPRAGRSRARAAAAHAGSRRSGGPACGSRRSSAWRRAGRPPPASRVSTPGRVLRAPGQMRGGQSASPDCTSMHPVAQAVEEVVDAARVAAEVGRGSAPRAHRVLDRRHRLERRVVDRVGVREPRGVGRQVGEVADSARRRCCRRAAAACPRGTRRRRAPPPAAGLACRRPPPPSQAARPRAASAAASRAHARTRRNVKRPLRSASQEPQRPCARHLEHLDEVAPVVQRGLGNHQRVVLARVAVAGGSVRPTASIRPFTATARSRRAPRPPRPQVAGDLGGQEPGAAPHAP